jgi:hypothetical protein
MLLFAFSFEAEVEKYGAYLGIASFFGLAVLSLLYFSQARELKRLREWAGRAPERARELEQRVVAQATATVARRPSAAAAPGAKMAPPRRLAEMPAPPPATAGAAAAAAAEPEGGATQVADADPETNGSVPPAPGAAVPEPAAAPPGNGAKPAEGEEAEAAEQAEPVADPNETHEFDAEQAAAATGAAEDDEAPDEAAEEPAEETGEHEAPAAPATAAGAAAAGAAGAAAPGASAAAAASATGPETDPSVPRLTPAQRVGVAPRPEPLPLRQSQPSATPAGRRPAAKPAARRPAPEREGEGRSAGTIALLVGLAVLLLGGAAFGASQLFGGDDNAPQPNQAAPPPTQTATTEGGEANAATPASETTVAVLNGTTFNGLAGNLADQLSQEGGYQRGITETNVRDQTLQESTVYYADGFRRQARDVAKLLTISTVQPIDEETAALAQGADVVVLAGADQAP